MRKKNQNYGGHKRNNRFGGGGHHGGGHHQSNHRSGGNGPRKNWPLLREKYLSQARDALASGDRVMSEYFHQHADHCWRMMMEEGYNRPRPQQLQEGQAIEGGTMPVTDEQPEAEVGSQLPAFLTNPYASQPQAQPAVDPSNLQNWEERDA